MHLLKEILSLKRPHGGKNERYLAEVILARLERDLMVWQNKDKKPMAYYIEVPSTTLPSKVCFTAHLDTCHNNELLPNAVKYDESIGLMWKDDKECLGADDGAGIWLLYRMIEAGVPGTYLFPLGEECGGVGAKWLADNASDWLSNFDHAIAFDRAGTSDVITYQGYGRCCSDEFATALSEQLNIGMAGGWKEYKPCPNGVYTDTAEFVDLIPECTNVSVGYKSQHSGNETQDTDFLQDLLKACLQVNWAALPVKRDPKALEPQTWSKSEYNWWKERDDSPDDDFKTLEEVLAMPDEEIEDFVYAYPAAAAELFIQMKEGGW